MIDGFFAAATTEDDDITTDGGSAKSEDVGSSTKSLGEGLLRK